MANGVPTKQSFAKPLGCSIVGCFILALLVLFTPLGIPLIWGPRLWWANRQNEKEYERRQDRYNLTVASISLMKIEPGQEHDFVISADRDPATLLPAAQRDGPWQEGRLIRAWREPDGRLTVAFITRDFGHLGSYWLYYCTQPLRLYAGERSKQVAPNWWAVYDPRG
jgi:hypothetical protein